MTEAIWLMSLFWIILLLLSWKTEHKIIPAFGGLLGLLFGFSLMSEVDRILGLIIVFIGIYQLYTVVFEKK